MIEIDYKNLDLEIYWEEVKKETFQKPKSDSKNKTLKDYQDKLFIDKKSNVSLEELYRFLQEENDVSTP